MHLSRADRMLCPISARQKRYWRAEIRFARRTKIRPQLFLSGHGDTKDMKISPSWGEAVFFECHA